MVVSDFALTDDILQSIQNYTDLIKSNRQKYFFTINNISTTKQLISYLFLPYHSSIMNLIYL